jgi:putative Mn2+ efflux pump MntP
MGDIGKFISFLLYSAMISFVLLFLLGGYAVVNYFSDTVIESKVIAKPDYRLEANGKTVDTVYIYRFK